MRHLIQSSSIPLASLLSALHLVSCTSATSVSDHRTLERGPAAFGAIAQNDPYLRNIQPIFSNRCVVCHTCVDAPCQLHLDSYPGIQRGATVSEMGASNLDSPPTRPKDASSITEWRSKGFFSVLAEIASEPSTHDSQEKLNQSLLYRFIQQGYLHNKPGFRLDSLDEHREEDNSCISSASQFNSFIRKYPGAGMPYGLPALDPDSFRHLTNWIAAGAPGPSPETARALEQPSQPEMIEEWENFLNSSVKARISARYIFEHTFSAHIHFEGTPEDEFFELVRSRTPFPQPVDEIVTELPYDPPIQKGKRDSGTFYYRFKKYNRTIVRKTHVLWELNKAKLLGLKMLFLETPWNPQGDAALSEPDYASINPFEYFRQIPAEVRYRFLLQNSQLIVNAMIRGPVCTGRVATDAIRDHFWVIFVDPAADVTVMDPTIAMREWASLGTQIKSLLSERPMLYNEAMRKFKPEGFSPDDIWRGDGTDPNAMLTVLRHETSATVHQGAHSGRPDTIWLMNFSNLERIYYNLVVDFKPWGNLLHKLSTWNFMSLHRSEAEERFISLLPGTKLRKGIRTAWTHGLGGYESLFQKRFSHKIGSRFQVREDAPIESILEQLFERIPQSITQARDSLTPFSPSPRSIPTEIRSIEDWEQSLKAISSAKEFPYAQYLPDVVFIRFMNQPYTLITNRTYSFINIVVLTDLAREPEKDTLSAFRGLYGDKPEIFIDLKPEQAANFLNDLQRIHSEMDWSALKEVYAVRRNNPKVWPLLDWFQNWDRQSNPLEAGVFDMVEYDAE